MFRFPFGTMHELNLDWFLQEWEIYKQEWADAQAGIDNALQGEIDRVEDAMQDLYDARDAAVQAKEDAEDAADSVVSDAAQCGADSLKAEGYAVGEQDGIPVGAGSPYYQQNAKYYKVEAGTYRYLSEAYAKGEMGGSPVAPGEAGYQDNAKYYKDAADADAVQTAADRVQTGLDAAATAADRVQTGLDAAATSLDKDDADHFKDAANQAALKAEGTTYGTQNGTPVSSDSPYYENNAAYYYGQSAGTSGELAQAMIAREESSMTLTAAYSAGSYIRVAGILYQTDIDLASGETLIVGTNCHISIIGDDLQDVKDSFSMENALTRSLYNIFTLNASGSVNGRTLKVYKNKISLTRTNTGSTYYAWGLTNENGILYRIASGSGTWDSIMTSLYNNGCFVDPGIYPLFNGKCFSITLYAKLWGIKSSKVELNIATVTENPDNSLTFYRIAAGELSDNYSVIVQNIPIQMTADILSGKKICVFLQMRGTYESIRDTMYAEISFEAKNDFRTLSTITSNHEANFTASKAYSVGELLTVQTALYRVTSAIANGALINPGANVAIITIESLLASI